MSTGLKNGDQILNTVMDSVQFAVNEECQSYGGCSVYDKFLAAGKPVYHIEYAHHSVSQGDVVLTSDNPDLAGMSSDDIKQLFCLQRDLPKGAKSADSSKFSTVIKNLSLDGWVLYCDGTYATTPIMQVGTGGPDITRGGRNRKGPNAYGGRAGRGGRGTARIIP
jgi:hypothetical protein